MPNALELKGRPRRRLCEQVRREEPNCWLCGRWIDLTLPRYPQPHPMSSTIHEVIPRSLHPLGPRFAALDRANCHHAHRLCNGRVGNRVGARVPETVRSQTW